ncbi:MAG: sulfotransferase family 2 domain-containing protein [Phycisphaeraceae bacterium]|nr:MAG: sulfotransferase family 2 domain-containing protein [Phycisphaeraceae bacterium]
MISHAHRCIFVKVPKTAGTSISRALACEHLGKPHRDIIQIRDTLAADPAHAGCFETYFKFGFVRNPWDRVVSLFSRKERGREQGPETWDEFVEWIENASDTCVHPTPHRNQLDWFLDERGEVAVDFIGRFERLDTDFATICERLGLDVPPLPHEKRNPAGRKHFTEYYTAAQRDLIGEKFRVDVEHFGYTFEG